MKRLLFILLFLPLFAGAQNTQYFPKAGSNFLFSGDNLIYLEIDAATVKFNDTIEARGGSLTISELLNTNYLVVALKSDGTWDTCVAIYPFVGGTAVSCAVNLKSPGTFDLTFVNTVAGDFTSDGWKPNGSTSYARTGIIPSSHLKANSAHTAVWTNTNLNGVYVDIGAAQAAAKRLLMSTRYIGGELRGDIWDGGAASGRISVLHPSALGIFIINRTSATVIEGWKNCILLQTVTNATIGTRPDIELYLGCLNNAGSPASYSPRQQQFVTIGYSLSNPVRYCKIVQKFIATK